MQSCWANVLIFDEAISRRIFNPESTHVQGGGNNVTPGCRAGRLRGQA